MGEPTINSSKGHSEVASDESFSELKSSAASPQAASSSSDTPLTSSSEQSSHLWSKPADPPASTIEMLQSLGRFKNLTEIGHGGFSVVYRAEDSILGRTVALKVPRLRALQNRNAQGLFLHEARTTAQLDHEHIVSVYDVVQSESICCIVAAYCPGLTLGDWLQNQEHPVPSRMAAKITLAIAKGLAHAHARGVVHRDLKPSNVLLFPNTSTEVNDLLFVPKLTDFGLAKVLEESFPISSSCIAGTPAYMAPEQAVGHARDIGTASDVYSLGVLLFQMLTGELPFPATTFRGVMARTLQLVPPSPRKKIPAIDADLDAICRKCLQLEPEFRYADGQALADDLNQYLNGKLERSSDSKWKQVVISWMRRPERMVEAGVYGTLLNSLVIGWMMVNAWRLRPYVDPTMRMQLILESLQFAVLIHVPMLIFSLLLLRRNMKWPIVSVGLSLIIFLLGAVPAAGGPGPFDFYWNNAGFDVPLHLRGTMFSLLTLLFGTQTAYFCIAWIAWRRQVKHQEVTMK